MLRDVWEANKLERQLLVYIHSYSKHGFGVAPRLLHHFLQRRFLELRNLCSDHRNHSRVAEALVVAARGGQGGREVAGSRGLQQQALQRDVEEQPPEVLGL